MRWRKVWATVLILGMTLFFIPLQAEEKSSEQAWEEAEHTPFGKYPETVVYTLGKIIETNNSNLPIGETHENNEYTRYLKNLINIQNENVIELENGFTYNRAVDMAIQDNNIPDILVINGRDTLKKLVKKGMIEDLTETYKECTSERIKEMYSSYGEGVLESATFDGKFYAFPETVIDHGSMLLWLRQDWMEILNLSEPETLEEGMEIIRQFVEEDMAGDGKTIGLACSTELISGSSSTYGVDPIFTKFGSVPGKWIMDEKENVVYGSVTEETKEALCYLHELYETGVIDSRFLLRKKENLDKMVADGYCGAVFGRWWAPNNPLSFVSRSDESAVWKPFLLTKENHRQTLESYKDWQYVVVRKGYEHPEIVAKYISVIFDYSRYEDRNAKGINDYFATNVGLAAGPMNINVDYFDGLYRVTDHILEVLDGKKRVQELNGFEKAYYQTCKSYMDGSLTTVNGWAAYASRIQAVGLISQSGRGTLPLSMGEADGEIPAELQKLEKETFLQIVCGEKPIQYFDTFVKKWYKSGGTELTRHVQSGY